MNCKVLYNARCYAEKRFSTCTWVNWFLQSVIDWYSYWLTHCECWSTVLSRSPPPCTSIRQVGKMTIFAGASRWFQMRFFYVFLLSKLQGCTKSMCSIVFWVGWNMLEQTKRIHVARRGTSWRPCWFTWCCWAVAGLMSIWSQACRFKTFGGALARVEPPLW